MLVITIKSFSQITFEKYYDYGYAEAFYSVKETADSGFVAAGRQGIWFSDSRMLFIKTDKYGNEQWHKFVGVSGTDNYAYSIVVCSNGGYAAVGFKSGIGFVEDVFLVRLDNNGDTLWTKQYGTAIQEEGFYIQQTSDMGFVMSFVDQNLYSGLIKTDSLGNEQWTKKYKAFDGLLFESVLLGSSGFVLSGRLMNNTTGEWKGVILRTDSNGDSLWLKDYASNGGAEFMEAKETNDGNIIVVGRSLSFVSSSYTDFYVVKIDTLGNIIWEKTIGGQYTDECYSVAVCNDGGYLLAGTTYPNPSINPQILIVKINSTGDSLWSAQYGGVNEEYGYSVVQTNDGGYAIAGLTDSPVPVAAYLIKTNSIGTLTTIDEQENSISTDFVAYPNPAQEYINLKFKDNSEKKIQLFDITGKKVAEPIISNETFVQLNTSTFENGIYFLNVNVKNNNSIQKIIINN